MSDLFQQTYCIDYNGWVKGISKELPPKQIDYDSLTIPELIYTKATSDRVAAAFDVEKQSLTFSKIVSEMESLAAGLLSIGLKQGDRVLVAGSNHSQVMISALACSRAGLIFSLANPNYPSSAALKRALEMNQNENLSPMDFRKFCEKRFRFKEMTIMRYTNPREREKAQQERKANAILKRSGFGVDYKNILEKNEPGNFVLSSPSGAILIDLTPLEKGKRSGPRKPFLLNPMGKTTVSVLNEFVQRLVKGALVYEAEDTRNVSCPYKATAVLSMKRSTLQEMSQECRESLIVLCEIAAMNDDPNSGTEDIAKFPIGKGVGANKKTSRLSAAKDALSKLVPKLRISDDYICEGVLDEATKNDFDRESRELFKKVLIDSQNLAQLCTQFMIPKPYTLLTNAVSRYIRWNGMELETVKDAVGNGKSRVVLKLGDMEGEAIAVGVKQAMQYAAQLLLKKMHPELLKYGSFLEMYGRLEYKERLESAKKQHDQVVRLSDTGNLTLPNYIVLGKLSEEMKNVVLSHPSRRSLFGAVNTEVVRKRSVFCQYSPEDSVPPVPPMSQYFAPGEQEVPPSDFDQRSLYPYLSPQNSLANPRKRAFPEEFLPVQPGSRLPPYQFPSS
uniref:DRBM domain-containing protein n=1 Tax=Caenorhabditis japonica TaxID=281687 RepID=A0A8R1IJ18_CAEJA